MKKVGNILQTEVFDENGEFLGYLPVKPYDQEVVKAVQNFGEGEIQLVDAFTVNAIIFSYNRPRMLREALLSIKNQTYGKWNAWVVDDGSDFDVVELIKEFEDERIIPCVAPKLTPEERVDPKSTRFQDNVNYILEQIPKEENLVTYLCDDDIFHPQWFAGINFILDKYKIFHSVNADCFYFWDGQNPFKEGVQGFLSKLEPATPNDALVWWQIGSFAHLSKCFYECDIKWAESKKGAHSWDIDYVKKVWNAHPNYIQMQIGSVYRREHANALSHKLGRFSDGAYVLEAQPMKPEHVSGMME
jgi:glycosyltransferase involved in cell wall biosynthesis